VKLLDVYPTPVPRQPEMGGYQLGVAMDIFRGRYRESFETAKPLASERAAGVRFVLPTANHVFLPGHRVMVQIQSTGSRSTTATRRPSCPTSSSPSRGTT
jgi:predicted acyl esterase